MSIISKAVQQRLSHRINRGGNMLDQEPKEIINRAKKENWWWQPYEDIPSLDTPVISVSVSGKRVPMYRLSKEKHELIRDVVTNNLKEAIKRQIDILQSKSLSSRT